MTWDMAMMEMKPVNKCKHINGIFRSINYLKVFHKRVFICTDCWELSTIKEYCGNECQETMIIKPCPFCGEQPFKETLAEDLVFYRINHNATCYLNDSGDSFERFSFRVSRHEEIKRWNFRKEGK